MAQPPTFTDVPAGQQVRHGSQLVTFSNAGILVAERIEFTKPMNAYHAKNGDPSQVTANTSGAITRSAYSPGKATGTMLIQIKLNQVVQNGETVDFLDTDFSARSFIVIGQGPRYAQGESTKIEIQIAERAVAPQLANININNDGDLTTAQPCGVFRFSRPIPQLDDHFVIRQRFSQFRNNWTRQAMGTAGPNVGQNTYLVEETELEDVGVAGVVEWDRVWATIPAHYEYNVAVVKTFKYLFKAFSGSTLIDATVISQSRMVTGVAKFDYGLAQYAASPVPDVSIWRFAGFGGVWTQNGFPFSNDTGVNSNEGFYPVSCDIGLYMGNIWYRHQVWAST